MTSGEEDRPEENRTAAGETAETPFLIRIRADRMAVDLEVRAPLAPGQELSVEQIKEELGQRGVVFGFDDRSLAAAILELAGQPQGTGVVRLADGQAPVAGGVGSLEYLVGPTAAGHDPETHDLVRPGQVLVRKIKASPGQPGRDVFGEELPAPAGKEPVLAAGEHVRLAGEDDTEYQAELYGRARLEGDRIDVEPLVEVAPDGMSAWVPIYPRLADNSALAYEHLEHSLQAAGVVHGIREEALRGVLEQQVVVPRMLAARGDEPEAGQDARVSFEFFLNDDDPVRVDAARRAGTLPPGPVRKTLRLKGEVLAVKTPPVAPVAGCKVTGEIIAGREGRDWELTAGENVAVGDEARVFFVADQLAAGYPDYQDGTVWVSDPLQVSDDAMVAYLQVHPPGRAERGFSGEQILQLLAAHGVTRGVRKQHIRRAVEYAAAHRRVLPRIVAARGRLPEDGRDATIEVLVQAGQKPGLIVEPTENIDFRERNTINSVRRGDLLARRTPPGPGVDGWTVRGETIAAKPGADLQFQPQPNVVISEDGLELLAGVDGMLTVLAPNKIAVLEIYEVKGDVDYRVGNLDMVGALLIAGWIRPGFTVKASGDIRVGGGVEDAKLIAGANVEIKGGMVSRGKGKIKAEIDVVARFLEWTRVHAGGNIVIHDQVMRSQVFAGGTLTVTAGKGRIRGGVCSAIQGIVANEIGSPAGVRTVVMAGANPALRRRLLQVDRQMAEYARQKAKMDTVLGRYLKHGRGAGLPPEVQRKLSLLAKQRRAVVQAEKRLARPREEMARQLAAIDLNKIRIVARKAVYAGTMVIIGTSRYKVREDLLRPVTFMVDPSGREVKTLDD
ncbi:flagellar assembly protein A [Desulfurivibrio alkaliphilus]|uniref:Flagellar Assembly Protein A N-terminal region domain-containing protein n=1 Tax=Desulfurivibrio alkaliphilus (strain DSM 19089 / UNIQEM U267 / AHT2) TaxID=589865 RepID=D6Z640_DESAT|nr:flagellar assembly protein A [Desulfurivibrio alkaliphilus]ADH84922.1 protein of unknown function DUF342 [Desulfurivibrio alkaliphilus AHT 2]